MKRFVSFGLFLTAAILLTALEIPIRPAFDLQWKGFHFRTADDCVIVFWTDTPYDSRDILAQKISTNGQTLWPEPISVVSHPGDQRLLSVTASSDNNFILLWEEYEIQTSLGLRLQKVTSNGQRLWSENGVPVTSGGLYVYEAELVPNSIGGAYAVWSDLDGFGSVSGQQVDGFGNQLWPAGGITLATHSSRIILDNLVKDGEGGMIINLNKDGISYLTRFSPQGTVIGDNPLIAPGSMPNFSTYSIAEGFNGEYILYRFGYPPNTGLWQRKVNNMGVPFAPYTWVASLPLNDNANLPPRLVPVADGGTMVCFQALPPSSRTLLAQRFPPDFDELMWGWPGVEIATNTNSNWRWLEISPTEQGAAWLSWAQFDDLQNAYLMKAQYVEPTGNLPWGLNGLTLSAESHAPGISLPLACPDRGIFVWQDRYDGVQAVRRQVLSTGGANFLAPGGLSLTESLNGRAYIGGNFALAGKFLTLWTDKRHGEMIMHQLSNQAMEPLLEPNGRMLNPGVPNSEALVDVQATPWNTVAVLYYDYPAVPRLQEIDANGECVHPGRGITITSVQNVAAQMKMGFSGTDIYLGWVVGSGVGDYQLWGQRVVQGEKMWGDNGRMIIDLPANCFVSVEAVTGPHLLFRIEDYNLNQVSSKVLRVDLNGYPAPGWNPLGMNVVEFAGTYYQWLGHSGLVDDDLVAFVHLAQYQNPQMRAQRINAAGQRLWQDCGVGVSSTGYSLNVMDAVYGQETAFLIYDIADNVHRLMFQSIDSDGEVLLDQGGSLVAYGLNNCYDANLLRFADESWLCVWSDNDGAWIQNRDVYIRQIDPQGMPLGNGPSLFCGARYQQQQVRAASIGNLALIAWNDDRAGILNSEEAITGIWAKTYLSSWVEAQDHFMADLSPLPFIAANYPNPFNPSTTISFSLPAMGVAGLAIYNVKGRRVRTLLPSQTLSAGSHSVIWDGKDEAGQVVSSGIYFCRLESNGPTAVRKMLLAK